MIKIIGGMTIACVLSLVAGLWIGYDSHPYEICKRMYDDPMDVSECVWIKENN